MHKTNPSESNPSPNRPTSERKATANRANAQRSTGPRTPQGKARSSLNALRHGILAKAAFNVTIEGPERRAEFEALMAGLAQEFQPRTMSEHMTVQQLAGCYWRLAKVWTHETEAAWRGWVGPSMPLEEMKEYEDFNDLNMEMLIRAVASKQNGFFPKAKLGRPTIPNGAAARTIVRYQSAIQTMLNRCLGILERRRKERIASGEEFEEQDYLNEPTEETATSSEASEQEVSSEKPAAPANEDGLHKRTQTTEADAAVSSNGQAQNDAPAQAASSVGDPKRRETP